MAFRAEYTVRKLPDDWKTVEKIGHFEEIPNGRKNRWGEAPQRMVLEDADSFGGWIIFVKGNPGHTIRIANLDQARAHKLKIVGTEIVPRLVDSQTGEEVDERGVPLSVLAQLNMQNENIGKTMNHVETDIDVHANNDAALVAEFDEEAKRLGAGGGGAQHVEKSIAALE